MALALATGAWQPVDKALWETCGMLEATMRLFRTKQVMAVTGLSRMTIYRLERAGLFPARRRLGENSVGWIDDDITSWIESRPHGVLAQNGTIPQLSLFP